MPPSRRPRPGGVKPKRSAAAPKNEGLGNVDKILARQAEKRALGRTSWVKVSDDEDEPTIIRAYDTTLWREGYIHQVEIEIKLDGKKKSVTRRYDRMCLDQDETGEPCPGCRDELERRLKFWFPVIERDAPIVTPEGKVTGYKDRVSLISGGSRLAAALNRIQKRKGLVNQDVAVSKSGEGYNVQYDAEPLDPKPLSAEDKAMIRDFDAVKKLDRYTKVFKFDEYYDAPKRDDEEDDDDDKNVGERSRRRGSSFGPRPGRGSATSQDDDDDDDEPAPRRRRSGRSEAGGRKPGTSLRNLSSSNDEDDAPRRSSSNRRRPPRRR